MKKRGMLVVLAGTIVLASTALLFAGKTATPPADETLWPTKGWATASPASVGLDEQVLLRLDKDMASGKYSQMMDSFAVFRCGKKVFERTYPHDYAKIYGKEAGERGPLQRAPYGAVQLFRSVLAPLLSRHGSAYDAIGQQDGHFGHHRRGHATRRLQSRPGYASIEILRRIQSEKCGRPQAPHDLARPADHDARAWNGMRRICRTATPQNDTSLMEATDDWVQYTIDKPMAAEPGKVWNYSSGATELLAYIFQKETGQDIDDYGQKYLFAPLGIRHEWKRTYLGVVDTEGGLYLNGSDLAKIGYLYLHDGMWDGQRIVSSEWVKESVTPYFQTDEPQFKYGFKWWLSKLPDSTEYVWMARGFGGQNLMVFPNEGLIVTFTAWDILPTSTGKEPTPSDFLPAGEDQNLHRRCPLMLLTNKVALITGSGRENSYPQRTVPTVLFNDSLVAGRHLYRES